MEPIYITALGQDSHRFMDVPDPAGPEQPGGSSVLPGAPAGKLPAWNGRRLMLGGVAIPGDCPPLSGNSDADVILHALTNAVSGYSGVNILGGRADELCRAGVTDSAVYLQEALATLPAGVRIVHVSFSLEGRRPKLKPHIDAIKASVGRLLGLPPGCVGLTATSGEGLTAFGRGEGLQALCLLTLQVTAPDKSPELRRSADPPVW